MVTVAGKIERAAVTNLLDWWGTMGVDTAISETPNNWLRGEPASTALIAAEMASKITQPLTLGALIETLMNSTVADVGPASQRVGPSGTAGSELMIMTDFPEPSDIAAGELLSDPIFLRMIEAIGRDRKSVYIASLCAGRPATGRLSDDDISAVSSTAKQHVTFVGPKCLWLVGRAASRAVLGFDDVVARGKLHHFNYDRGTASTIATAHPRMFEGSKSRKAAAWTEMQRLVLKDDV